MDLRTGSPDDVEACRDLFFASFNELHRRYGQEEEDPGDHAWFDDGLRHLLRTDPGGTVVAQEDGELHGFASSYRRQAFWFLSFLFVRPVAQGRGLGKALLDAVMPEESGGLTRALVVESFQPVSTGLYASYGIVPQAMRYRLGDLPDPGRLPSLPGDLEVEDLTVAVLSELDELDRRQLGYARDVEHRWWLSSDMVGRAYRRGGDLVGYGYRNDTGDVSPAMGRDETTLCAIVADLLRGAEDPAAASVPVWGNARELFRMLVRSGARISPAGYLFLYCSSGDPPPPTYVAYSGYLP